MQIKALLESFYSVPFIASTLRCHPQTVINWETRFANGETFEDKPRSGRPPLIPLEAKIRLTAFYCQHSPLPGCSRWSIRWAEKYLNNHLNIVGFSMSRSSLHRYLMAHALKPHLWKYFLPITDPYFFEKMENIIWLYLNPPKYLFSLDECTGLQVLERIAPDLDADGKLLKLIAFEYKRHGTVSLLSILEIAHGIVYTDCIDDHTSVTIIQSLKNHIAMYDPSETLHYILDNYSSHSTIEIWFAILKQKALKGESFSSVTACKETILNFTDTYNAEFSHPFEWSYTGDGLHEKVVSRLTKWIVAESTGLRFKFFEKQLHLMTNLVNNY